MALVLTLREGESFWLNEREIRVKEVFGAGNALLQDRDTGDVYEVTNDRAADLGGEACAHISEQPNTVAIAIEAPREVKIQRDSRKRRGGR